MVNLKGINKDRNPTVPCYRPSGTGTFLSRRGSAIFLDGLASELDSDSPSRDVASGGDAPSFSSGKHLGNDWSAPEVTCYGAALLWIDKIDGLKNIHIKGRLAGLLHRVP
jgi:hypothetical protein